MTNPAELVVVRNASQERYEIHVGDELAGFTEAHPQADDAVLFNHTVVFEAFKGQGLAGKLVAGAFDDLRLHGLTAKVTCPYILGWLPKHPEYQDVVSR